MDLSSIIYFAVSFTAVLITLGIVLLFWSPVIIIAIPIVAVGLVVLFCHTAATSYVAGYRQLTAQQKREHWYTIIFFGFIACGICFVAWLDITGVI